MLHMFDALLDVVVGGLRSTAILFLSSVDLHFSSAALRAHGKEELVQNRPHVRK